MTMVNTIKKGGNALHFHRHITLQLK